MFENPVKKRFAASQCAWGAALPDASDLLAKFTVDTGVDFLWVDLEHRKLLPAGILPATVQLARRGIALHTNNGLRSLVEQVIGTRTFADLVVPFQCVATDIDQTPTP